MYQIGIFLFIMFFLFWLVGNRKREAEFHVTKRFCKSRRLMRLCQKNEAIISKTCRQIMKEEVKPQGNGKEWLLDNRYLMNPPDCRRMRLPVLISGSYRKYPRIYALSAELVERGNGIVREDDLLRHFGAFQKMTALTEEELSVIPEMLRIALLSRITSACRKMHQNKDEKEILGIMSRTVSSLWFLDSFPFRKIYEELSKVEEIFLQDPAGIYQKMTKESCADYRSTLSRLAKKRKISQKQAAEEILRLAKKGKTEKERHIGYYLQHSRKRIGALVIATEWIITLLLSALTAFLSHSVFIGIFLILPLSEAVKATSRFFVNRSFPASRLPQLKIEDSLTPEQQTLAVICALAEDSSDAAVFAEKLEDAYLGNRLDGLYFGLLIDLPDSDRRENSGEKRIQKAFQNAVDQLNKQYGNRFVLFFRERSEVKSEGVYRGWERKRGALLQLAQTLAGKGKTLSAYGADLPQIRYVITLDSDTKLTMGAAAEMIGKMAHPLHTPKIKNGIVVSGYGIMQPRTVCSMSDAYRCIFSQLFSGESGSDPYSFASFDFYQEMFGKAIFTGKGIFDLSVYHEVLKSAFPENAVLSHDLAEGGLLRCGFLGDVTLTDGFPKSFLAYYGRQHRWIRGDWQLLPFIADKRFSPLTRYQMIDNLTRSLQPVFHLLFFVLSLLIKPQYSAYLSLLSLGLLLFPVFIAALQWLLGKGWRTVGLHSEEGGFSPFLATILNSLISAAALPYRAWVSLDAVCRTIWRVFVSRKKLLEWVTAAQGDKKKNGLFTVYRKMWLNLLSAIIFPLLATDPFTVILCMMWFFAPFVCFLISKEYKDTSEPLSSNDKEFLEEQARKIWQYFCDFFQDADSYLVPDNFQTDPPNGLARRTSPTNIGLQIATIITACDFGWIKADEAENRLAKVLSTIDKLEQWKGHLYNWYDTESLAVLTPRYISTVDSGNYVACLLLAESFCQEMGFENLRVRFHKMAEQTDFRSLYIEERRLLSIGYDAEKQQLTPHCYDLMASEARMASYVAVALGQLPKKHWYTLGRPLGQDKGYSGLLSWSGTMFEYLMPLLFLKNVPHTLWAESYRYAIRQQKNHGEKHRIPWGVSECSFYSFDHWMNYQYKAIGVPALGLKRYMEERAIASPYAGIMALMVKPEEAIKNLRDMLSYDSQGEYGFYEAIDFTNGIHTVRSFMVHHLGMSLLALNNVLHDNKLQKRFHALPSIRAAEELLEEKFYMVPTAKRRGKEELAGKEKD